MNDQKDIFKVLSDFFLVILSALLPFLAVKIKNAILRRKKALFDKTHNKQWSREVFENLVELRTKSNADRAWIILRSNGTSYYNGLKGDHLTMVYESLEKGVSGILPSTQKIPVHFYEDTIERADKDGSVIITTKNLHEGSHFKATLEQNGTKHFIGVPIKKCQNSIPEGYVGLSYLDLIAGDEEELIHTLKEYSARIGLFLRVNKK